MLFGILSNLEEIIVSIFSYMVIVLGVIYITPVFIPSHPPPSFFLLNKKDSGRINSI